MRKIWCWLFGHDTFEVRRGVICRRCFSWWRKYAALDAKEGYG